MPKTKPMNSVTSGRAPNAWAASLPAGRSLHHVSFFCEATNAHHISLVGDFNRWNPAATPMNRMPDGRWMASLELPHGHHRYMFLVDGETQLDPKAGGTTRNERNEPVSLIAVS